MKKLPLIIKAVACSLLVLSLLSSCTIAHFKGGPNPSATLGNVGAKQKVARISIGPDILIEGYDTDAVEGFKAVTDMVRKMWSSYLMAEGLKFVAGQYYNLEGAKVASAKHIKLEELRNAKSTADAAARLEELKLMEVPVGPAPAAIPAAP